MKSSAMKYISVSTPHTYNVNTIHVPPKVLMPPIFHPPKWKRASVREGGSASNLQDSQDSVSESLAKEGQYQLGLQQRILENEELVGLCSDELENNSLEEDSLEEMSSKEEEYDTSTNGTQKKGGSGRKQQSVGKHSSLRYNPNWKKTQMAAEFFGAEQASQVAGGSSVDFSQDSFYLHSSGSSGENHQQESKTQVSFSEFGSELLSFHEPNVLVSNEPVGLQTKKKESADGCRSKGSPGTCGSALPLQNQQDRPQRAKKNFVKKNKQTLGLPSERVNSYLELHKKKQVLQEQVTDPKTVDEEEPLQGVPPSQTAKMKPEDKWCLKGQQLKDQHSKFSQRSKPKPNQSLKGRAFPRNHSQQPPGRAAEPKSCHPSHQQTPAFQAVASAVDESSALQECLHPDSSGGPDADPAAKSNTCLIKLPNSRPFVKQDFTTSTYPLHPTLHRFNPAEVVSPAYTSTENKACQQDSPGGIPHGQQHLHSQVPGQHFARADRTNGHAHPKQRNSPSTFNTNFQELMKDQVPLQDSKKHTHEDKRSSQPFVPSSPPAPCATSQIAEMMEQHHPGGPALAGAHFATRWLLSLLPPASPQLQSAPEGDPEGGEGKPEEKSSSNSDGYLMQMTKHTQHKGSEKPRGTKVSINLNVKLGGLGPDYEAIKEKKQKLKLQKEYSRQIKEYNMKNITFVQRLPKKPQVTSSVSRQKALEYAKKIPRPKTFMTRQSKKEVKEKGVLPQSSDGTSLPQIPSLEILRSRHEKEKEVVAAFKALHIL